MNRTAYNSAKAQVSIDVTAAETDPETVGKPGYDAVKQYLLRTMRGIM